ncbi:MULTISPECIES: TlpA disulfide reductase family protein [unclassified Crossiella]|uniref:TlpA family protein disulfide reductase n=1 Tax=unclassified Crossiella TaxID=2620835 RepID=UPI001FFFC711|nr:MULTISPECIES: TlpA disulfide reductase family protein [unclassified Crossiella]MCK2242606.1 TlpA family protein disulfide reductase [Crossiella sp. S99.2]MCK2256483.1 TlpA family protein disulfide reductase [Crossiella sp. S99.1]
MRASLVLLLALLLAACTPAPPPAPVRGGSSALPGPLPPGVTFRAPPAEAAAAPDFTVPLTDGAKVTASALWKDRPLVVVFFSSWCAKCGSEQAKLTELATQYKDKVVFLGVAARDTEPDLRGYLDKHQVPYPVGQDDQQQTIGRSYALAEPPLLAVVAPGGGLIKGLTSANAVGDALRQLVG